MKHNNDTNTSPPPSAWHEVWELILLVVFHLGLCVAVLSAALLFSLSSAQAGDNITSLDEVRQGSLLYRAEAGAYLPAPALRTEVTITVSGIIARARIRQRFENDSEQWVEGLYVFPLPEDAAVDHMRLQIGERIIEGQIQEREAAKRRYEKAKGEGTKAALIEQQRPNLFTNAVANIAPHESVVVEIEYQQILRYDNGEFRLRFPMAITPRYISGAPLPREEGVNRFDDFCWAQATDQVPDAARITPPVQRDEGQVDTKVNPLTLTVQLNAGFPLARVSSPYHAIRREDRDAAKGITTIDLSEGAVYAERDFELSWAPTLSQAPRAALFSEQLGAEVYHFLMVLPPSAELSQQRLPREVIYIIDTSGSMAGTSIEQARQALMLALQRLRPQDRFNIIAFNSSTDQLLGEAQAASTQNLERAGRYVAGLRADGGTEMMPALQAALRNQQESAALRQVIFLTDGSVGNEEALFGLITRQLGRSRLFTIGIGSAPNSYFMSKAARFGRGTFTYIGDLGEVQSKMAVLFGKLEAPLMSDLVVDAGNAVLDSYPQRLPDLYRGEPLIIASKTTPDAMTVTVRGQRQQAQWQSRITLQNGIKAQGVGVLWARRKIADLLDQQQQGGDLERIRKDVIDVALQHHLVSKYTSLVAVDITPSRPLGEGVDTRALPVNLPHGQVHEKIFGRLSQTATYGPLNLFLGAVLLLLALAVNVFSSRRAAL